MGAFIFIFFGAILFVALWVIGAVIISKTKDLFQWLDNDKRGDQ